MSHVICPKVPKKIPRIPEKVLKKSQKSNPGPKKSQRSPSEDYLNKCDLWQLPWVVPYWSLKTRLWVLHWQPLLEVEGALHRLPGGTSKGYKIEPITRGPWRTSMGQLKIGSDGPQNEPLEHEPWGTRMEIYVLKWLPPKRRYIIEK